MPYSKNLGNVKGDKGSVFKPILKTAINTDSQTEIINKDEIKLEWILQNEDELTQNILNTLSAGTTIPLPYYVPYKDTDANQIQWELNITTNEPTPISLEEIRGPQGRPGITVKTVPNYDGNLLYIEYLENNNIINPDDIDRIIYYHHYGNGVTTTPIESGIIFLILDAIDPNDETQKTTVAYIYDETENIESNNNIEDNIENNDDIENAEENNNETENDISNNEEYYRYIEDESSNLSVSYDIRNFVKIEQPIDLTNYYNKIHIDNNYYTKIEIDNVFERIKDIQTRIVNILDGDLTKFIITTDNESINELNNILNPEHRYSLIFDIYIESEETNPEENSDNENSNESNELENNNNENSNEFNELNESNNDDNIDNTEELNESANISIIAYMRDEDTDELLKDIIISLECSHNIITETEISQENEEYIDENDIFVDTYISRTNEEGEAIFNLYLQEYNEIKIKAIINDEDLYGIYIPNQETEDPYTLIIDNRG